MERKSFSLIFKRKNLVCKCTPNQGIVLMIKRNNKSLTKVRFNLHKNTNPELIG